jgi:hypothetical protein
MERGDVVSGAMEPQEIEDEEYEQILDRVAAVDVAKASGMVGTGAASGAARPAEDPGVAGGCGDERDPGAC